MGHLLSPSAPSLVGALGFALLVGACSSEGGDLRRADENIRLPARAPEKPDAGPAGPSPTNNPKPSGPTDASADAGPARSPFCSEPNLVLCYEFEGNTNDGSGNALNPATVEGVSFIPGKAGQAAELGATSFIRLGYSALLNVTGVTIEAWVNLSPDVLSKGVVFIADNRYSMEIDENGELKCIAAGGAETGGVVVKGQFTHVACTIDSVGAIRNYVGGIERKTGAGRLATSDTATAAIGGGTPSGSPFVGSIDSLRVFGSVRTATEIAQAAQ